MKCDLCKCSIGHAVCMHYAIKNGEKDRQFKRGTSSSECKAYHCYNCLTNSDESSNESLWFDSEEEEEKEERNDEAKAEDNEDEEEEVELELGERKNGESLVVNDREKSTDLDMIEDGSTPSAFIRVDEDEDSDDNDEEEEEDDYEEEEEEEEEIEENEEKLLQSILRNMKYIDNVTIRTKEEHHATHSHCVCKHSRGYS